MLDLITEITAITGRMKPLPQWSQQGAVAGLEGGTEVSNYILDGLINKSDSEYSAIRSKILNLIFISNLRK